MSIPGFLSPGTPGQDVYAKLGPGGELEIDIGPVEHWEGARIAVSVTRQGELVYGDTNNTITFHRNKAGDRRVTVILYHRDLERVNVCPGTYLLEVTAWNLGNTATIRRHLTVSE